MDVKQRILAIIEASDVHTVRNVALRAGLSDSALNKFLTNPDHSMTLRNLEKIADVLGVTIRELLVDEPTEGETAEIVDLWARIASTDRPKAKSILEAFSKAG